MLRLKLPLAAGGNPSADDEEPAFTPDGAFNRTRQSLADPSAGEGSPSGGATLSPDEACPGAATSRGALSSLWRCLDPSHASQAVAWCAPGGGVRISLIERAADSLLSSACAPPPPEGYEDDVVMLPSSRGKARRPLPPTARGCCYARPRRAPIRAPICAAFTLRYSPRAHTSALLPALQRDGETRLRAHLHATSEWQCSASREAAARACDSRPECGALAAALRGSGTLRKIQLLQARSLLPTRVRL